MEKIKKTILRALTIGYNVTGGTIIIPDLNAVYYIKFGLKQSAQDIGFFDAFKEPVPPAPPEPPEPPAETFYLVDGSNNPTVDDNNDNFIHE